ncbi:hypothetical protein J1614_004926 [Plenodomus biglobosus]|nr:hypothetical protein J1614_004926 [Plenodomus biglobosus]
MADLNQFPMGYGEQDIVTWGTTGLVCLDAASQTVIKAPHDDDNSRRTTLGASAHRYSLFVYAAKIVLGDLTLDNVFLVQDLDIKLADFGDSPLDGSDLLVSVHASHRYPGPLPFSNTDTISLGSALYNIMTGKRPYQDISEEEITALFKERKLPETDTLGLLAVIIRNCWKVTYKRVIGLCKDIEGTT